MMKQYEGFDLVGRDDELTKISGMLMRQKASNVLLVGPGGVGCSALCLGLQASKDDPNTPFDIVNKRFHWLDTDELFASGSHEAINSSFEKLRKVMQRSPDNVLIIEDFKDFVDAARNGGCTNFINALMRDVKSGKFQAIFETDDDDLDVVLKCHSNMYEDFTLMDVQEPVGDALTEIVKQASQKVEAHHKISMSEESIATAIELTSKYRTSDMSLSRAQPERSLNLLDRAMTSYRQRVHANPPAISALEVELKNIETVMQGGTVQGFQGWSESELETVKIEKTQQLRDLAEDWITKSDSLKSLYKNQREGENLLRELEDNLDTQRAKEEQEQAQREALRASGQAPQEAKGSFNRFSANISSSGFDSEEVTEIKMHIKAAHKAIAENAQAFDALAAEINAELELDAQTVMQEFSTISGIPADKLDQDEREKVLNLDASLRSRVFGQEEAVEKLHGAVLISSAGLKDPNKPQGSFLFAGPSGVGKTEIAKALASSLKDDERAMLRFDMSEYMEKHAVAKLIGAPPGYEGFEMGGILTNAVRRNPHSIILFDEIEKAHPDVFNVFLQVLDDARLTDNRGLTVSFADTIIIMTTNLGQKHFLNPDLSYGEAMEALNEDLGETYRPEFLNRFNGRENIVGFNALSLPIIEMIAKRELSKVNKRISSSGHDVTITMSDDTIEALCKDKYDPAVGARGIPGYFQTHLYKEVSKYILMNNGKSAIMDVAYNPETGGVQISTAQASTLNAASGTPDTPQNTRLKSGSSALTAEVEQDTAPAPAPTPNKPLKGAIPHATLRA